MSKVHKCFSLYGTNLVHGEVVVVNIRVVALELVQLDVDDPLFVSLHKMEHINYKQDFQRTTRWSTSDTNET